MRVLLVILLCMSLTSSAHAWMVITQAGGQWLADASDAAEMKVTNAESVEEGLCMPESPVIDEQVGEDEEE